MTWFLAGLFALGCILAAWGIVVADYGASADERIAGAFPILIGLGLIGLDVVVAFFWAVIWP